MVRQYSLEGVTTRPPVEIAEDLEMISEPAAGPLSSSVLWTDLVTAGIDPDKAYDVIHRAAVQGWARERVPGGELLTVTRAGRSRYRLLREGES